MPGFYGAASVLTVLDADIPKAIMKHKRGKEAFEKSVTVFECGRTKRPANTEYRSDIQKAFLSNLLAVF